MTEDLLPLLIFVFAGLFSPGPNVVMLTASGARFGFRGTLPHLLGVPVGTALLATASGLGVGALLLAAPTLKLALQIVAFAWILWLAFRTAQAGRVPRAEGQGRPLTFLEAVAFQAVNPKVWAVTLAASAGFRAGLDPVASAAGLALIFGTINLGVCLFWTIVGHLLAGLISSDRAWRSFMFSMAGLMALSALLIFL
ncbi:MAG: LysE family translocator [Sulfitobacter sp.]|nr:LysE family translocator [Sulfitobacter sp.]